jgi:hypothetical protein
MKVRRAKLWTAAVITAMTLVIASVALAAEAPARDEYVSRLERICKPNELATQRAMKGSRADLQAERLDAAAAKFARATRLFGATVREIGVEPRPPADIERLKQWFVYLNRQEAYLRQITAQLRAGHAVQAQRLTARFIHNGNLANNVVLAFGFDYCSFKFSRFG